MGSWYHWALCPCLAPVAKGLGWGQAYVAEEVAYLMVASEQRGTQERARARHNLQKMP